MKYIKGDDMDKLIKTLTINEKNIPILKKIKDMPNLRRLSIKNIKKEDLNLDSLSFLDLDTLILENCRFETLEFIRGIKTLYDLEIRNCKINSWDFFCGNQTYKSLTIKTEDMIYKKFLEICSYCKNNGIGFIFRNSSAYFISEEDFYMVKKEKTTKDAFYDHIIKTMI